MIGPRRENKAKKQLNSCSAPTRSECFLSVAAGRTRVKQFTKVHPRQSALCICPSV